jgi:NAD(P)H-nitrite reductase large subunit
MNSDDHVCLCFKVSQRKLVTFMNVEQPQVASQLSECFGAGTGCHWCVPFLNKLFEQWRRGEEPNLPVAPADYAARRKEYHKRGTRDEAAEHGE